jgi:hypothetical protein
MSLNDRPEIRRTFGAFRIAPIATKYSAANGHRSGRAETRRELLIRNY